MKKSICTLLASLAAPALVTAQAPGPRPEPSKPDSLVPPTAYTSTFGKYRRMSDEAVVRWKDANDTVEKIGGWQVYLKEGRQSEPAAGAQPNPDGRPGEKGK